MSIPPKNNWLHEPGVRFTNGGSISHLALIIFAVLVAFVVMLAISMGYSITGSVTPQGVSADFKPRQSVSKGSSSRNDEVAGKEGTPSARPGEKPAQPKGTNKIEPPPVDGDVGPGPVASPRPGTPGSDKRCEGFYCHPDRAGPNEWLPEVVVRVDKMPSPKSARNRTQPQPAKPKGKQSSPWPPAYVYPYRRFNRPGASAVLPDERSSFFSWFSISRRPPNRDQFSNGTSLTPDTAPHGATTNCITTQKMDQPDIFCRE